MNWIFCKGGEENGLPIRAHLRTLFWDFEVGEFAKSLSTCSKYEGDRIVELSLSVDLTFLGAPFIFTGWDTSFTM